MLRSLIAMSLLGACSQVESPPVQQTWIICDGIGESRLLLLTGGPPTAAVRMTRFDKTTGSPVGPPTDYALEASQPTGDGAYFPIQRDGETGRVRTSTIGVTGTPSSVYIPRVTSVAWGGDGPTADGGFIHRLVGFMIVCRWLPRTQLSAFTERRSFMIHEDVDGDLVYTAYDFSTAAQPMEISENAQTTPFSMEVRGGQKMARPDRVEFRFVSKEGYTYLVIERRDGRGRLDVERNGVPIQSEVLIAFQMGEITGE